MDWKNQLYYGDNLRVLREEIADESVYLSTTLYPRMNAATFKRATRQRRTQGEQTGLF